jgi:hypothetical protein
MNIKVIYIPKFFLFLNSSFTTTAGVEILIGEAPRRDLVIRDTFYYPEARHRACFRVSDLFLASTFRAQVLRLFPKSLANGSLLYEHMRSADIFKRWRVHHGYGQPPCSYYADVVALDGSSYSDVQVIAQDDRNPCVSALIGKGAHYKQQEFARDLGAMLWATKLVLGRGTLGLAVLYLSQISKSYYTFGSSGLTMPYGHHIDCEPTREYTEAILSMKWINSDPQREMMRTSKACKRWRDITHNKTIVT